MNSQYTLANPEFWHPIDPRDGTFRDLVENMKDEASESDNIPYGANVLDDNRNDIGDWYSTTDTTFIKLEDGKAVEIYAPTAETGGGGSSGGSGGAGGSGGSF